MPGYFGGWNIFTWRRIGVIHGQVIGPWRRAKYSGQEARQLSLAIEPWNECNDFRTHAGLLVIVRWFAGR
jgi:hypothetical protein